MDRDTILDALDLSADNTITLTAMRWILWGRNIAFAAQAATPDQEPMHFELRFEDCREMRWQLYTHQTHPDAPAFSPTELVNLKLGRDQHRSPAHLLTEHFGLSLSYGRWSVVPD